MIEIQPEQTPYELNIEQNTMIVTIVERTYSWDISNKGNDIAISNNDTVAVKKEIDDFETVLGTIPLTKGKYYWEITVISLIYFQKFYVAY